MNELKTWVRTHKSRMEAYRRIGAALGCTWQQCEKWAREGEVPLRRVAAVSQITGISPIHLNPEAREIIISAVNLMEQQPRP